jgi:ABC-2 type transport system permease protein
MNINLFLKEMRRNAFSLMIWMIVITLLVTLTMSVYRTFLENQSKITAMLTIIPKGALQFKGISNISDLLSVLGFYAANNVIYMMVLGSIFSMVLSSNILLKEEYDKTAEYLLTRPISRSEIFISKLSVIVLNVFFLNLVISLAGFIFMEIVKTGPFSIKSFLILSLFTFLLNILFGTLGLFLSTLVKRARPITTTGIGIVLIFYFIYTISKITESISKIGYISPFRYVDMNVISQEYKLDLWHLGYFVGISLLLIFLSFRIYLRKDIYT